MKHILSGAAAVALVLPVLLTSGAVATADQAPAAARTTHRLRVTGYALGGTSPQVIAASAKALTTVTVDGVSINAAGTGVARPEAETAAVRREAHRQGLRAELLVSNYSNDLEDFDPAAAHGLLSSAANISHVSRRLAQYVTSGHYDGVNIDLEIVASRDAAGLIRFAVALQQELPTASTVSVDISAATSVAEYRSQGYALKKLGAVVDVVQVMTYDQHGPGWSGPGPIGDLRWQKKALAALLTQVPAAKVDLGQADYGYAWHTSGKGTELTDRRARAAVRNDGARAVWHSDSGEWSATLTNGSKLWWADARSYAIRKKLAADHGLHGLAVWVLGSADPLR
ncbi:MAG: glycoside hydrolase family 18 [Marmoricola sp.]|nr:glycoside hydrolase family 18 [Marmoricola sp.]